jgi:hypothetical protein
LIIAVGGNLLISCGGTVDKISATLQDAIDKAGRESDAWRSVLTDLPNQLSSLESQVSADTKGVLGDTINEVSALQKQTFETAAALAKDTVAFTLIQVQCSASYFQSSVVSYLQFLKAKVTNSKAPLPAARVGNFNPDRFEIDPGTLQGSSKTWLANVYGYNFLPGALPAVQILDGSNHLVRTAQNQPVLTSLYQMQLQLVAADFVAPAARVGLAWPNGDRNFISVGTSAPAHLDLLDFQVPATITVNQPVVARLTIKNTGTTDSGRFEINWSPNVSKLGVVSLSVHSLAGNESQTYELPYAFVQKEYFNTPQTSPLRDLRTSARIVGNSGVSTNSTKSATFTLNNMPFYPGQPITITNPNVGKDWTSYQQQVNVRPGDIVTITAAGGCVQTGGRGNTWKRYVNPSASDAPNLYHGLIAIVQIMAANRGAPGTGARLMDYIGRPIPIPLDTHDPQFWLGYEDTNYSDNGYYDHDGGTDDQCVGLYGAWVTVQILRN